MFSDEAVVRKVLLDAEMAYQFVSSTVPGDLGDEGLELIKNVIATIQFFKMCVNLNGR